MAVNGHRLQRELQEFVASHEKKAQDRHQAVNDRIAELESESSVLGRLRAALSSLSGAKQ